MKNIFFIISLLVSSVLFAQDNGVIEGVVMDASAENAPMLFANVTVKETKQTLTTGYRGGYFFKDLKPGTYTLVFNFLGYKSIIKKVVVKAETVKIDAMLEPSTDINFESIQLTSK